MRNTLKWIAFWACFVSLFFIPQSGCKQAFAYSFLSNTVQEVFGNDSRIPITQANHVIQTKDGYIWVASYDGLIRYDGRSSKIYNLRDDGFPTHSIITLFEDSKEQLWIGTNLAGLVLYEDKNTFRVFDKKAGLPSNGVRAIAEAQDGSLYIATTAGLARLAVDHTLSEIRPEGYGHLIVSDLFVTKDNTLWCAMNDGSVLVIKNGEALSQYASRYFEGISVGSIFQDSKGSIYLGSTDHRVMILSPDKERIVMDVSPNQSINSFYEDGLGRVWICSDTGLGFFQDSVYENAEGLNFVNSLENIIEDFEGNLWISSSKKGLLQVLHSKFDNIGVAVGLPPLVVNGVTMHEGNLVLASDSGVYMIGSNGSRLDNKLTRMLDGVRTRAVIKDDNGDLWFSTYSNRGLIHYTASGEITSINQREHGLVSDKVRCALPTARGHVLVGTTEGLSIVQNNKVIRNYTPADGLENPMIMNLYEDENGVVYAGSDGGGIYRIDGDTITAHSVAEGLSSGIIMRMRHDPDYNGIWISAENGLCWWGEDGIRTIDKLGSQGLNIFDIQLWDKDEIWLLGSNGIIVASRENLLSDEEFKRNVLQKRDGLSATIMANGWNYLDQEGELYISTNSGVLSIGMNEVHQKSAAPKLIISSVTIDDQVISHPSEIKIPADAKRLTVNFALISYVYPVGNTVQVHLDGFDQELATLSTDQTTSVSYTNLPGGRYLLRLAGANKDGVASQELNLFIDKERQLLEIPLVRILIFLACSAAIAGLALLYIRYKTKAILKRQQEYREITDQAIRAIADTIDAKDPYTSGHSKRVAEYSLDIGKGLGLTPKELEDLYYSALLHDIGKIGVENSIINKKGKLTDEEFEMMKKHVSMGGDILKSITIIENIAIGARYHHERYDGRGYCHGLAGEEIPLFARIICVADAYDAMSTTRSYRDGMDQEYILTELERCAGKQFDGQIVKVMLEVIRQKNKLTHPALDTVKVS